VTGTGVISFVEKHPAQKMKTMQIITTMVLVKLLLCMQKNRCERVIYYLSPKGMSER
jgi:hypothetical protein